MCFVFILCEQGSQECFSGRVFLVRFGWGCVSGSVCLVVEHVAHGVRICEGWRVVRLSFWLARRCECTYGALLVACFASWGLAFLAGGCFSALALPAFCGGFFNIVHPFCGASVFHRAEGESCMGFEVFPESCSAWGRCVRGCVIVLCMLFDLP